MGVIGVLVAGGVIRTLDKTGNVAEARGLGQGRSTHTEGGNAAGQSELLAEAGTRGNGRGGYGQLGEDVERLYPQYETVPETWDALQGIVVQAPAAGVDMVVVTEGGEEVTVGTGPGYMEAQGFTLQAGETVLVQGYWEDGEFKAAQITRMGDGEAIALRDAGGRPAWAGAGRNAQNRRINGDLPQEQH